MTNKEKWLEEAINRIKYYNTDEPLKIVQVPFYNLEINALCDYFEQPTLLDCIKEWNEKGFDVDVYALEIVIHNCYIEFTIDLEDKTLFMEGEYNLFPYDVVHLLSKTLKALEEENDKN